MDINLVSNRQIKVFVKDTTTFKVILFLNALYLSLSVDSASNAI